MADLRTALRPYVHSASSDAPRREEQATPPLGPRAFAQGPAGLSPLRGASTPESQGAPIPEQARLRMKPPSHREEIAKNSPLQMVDYHDLEDSHYFSRESQRRELRTGKRAARQYDSDGHGKYHADPRDTDRKRFRKDKYGANQSFTRRAASNVDEDFLPAQSYVRGERSFVPKPGLGQRPPMNLAPRHHKTQVVPDISEPNSFDIDFRQAGSALTKAR